MSRDEFQYPKSLWERFVDWLDDRFDWLPESTGDPAGVSVGGPGAIAQILAWVVLLAAVALVLFVVFTVVHNRIGKSVDSDPPDEVEIEHRRAARQWASEAEKYETSGDWKMAIRARYRELVRTLIDRRQVKDLAGQTTGELRDDVAFTTGDSSEAFDTASLLFELPWYGNVPTGESENARFKEAAMAVLAAPIHREISDNALTEDLEPAIAEGGS